MVKKAVSVILTDTHYEWLRKQSYKSRKSMSEIIRDMISERMEKERNK